METTICQIFQPFCQIWTNIFLGIIFTDWPQMPTFKRRALIKFPISSYSKLFIIHKKNYVFSCALRGGSRPGIASGRRRIVINRGRRQWSGIPRGRTLPGSSPAARSRSGDPNRIAFAYRKVDTFFAGDRNKTRFSRIFEMSQRVNQAIRTRRARRRGRCSREYSGGVKREKFERCHFRKHLRSRRIPNNCSCWP